MSKYCCPNCHKNEQISVNYLAWVENVGIFGEFGNIESDDVCVKDSPDDSQEYYFCHSCSTKFYEPEEVVDEKDPN